METFLGLSHNLIIYGILICSVILIRRRARKGD